MVRGGGPGNIRAISTPYQLALGREVPEGAKTNKKKTEHIKKTWKIIGRVALGLFLTLYVVTALLNYSLVQSMIGSAIGSYFTKEWGGKVKIGSVNVDMFDHVSLRDVELDTPEGDTVLVARRISCRFNGIPYKDGGLRMKRVMIQDATFHFESRPGYNSFTFIIDYFKEKFKKKEKIKKQREPFVVDIKQVVMRNVRYRMTLPTIDYYANQSHSVDVANMDLDSINARINNLMVEGASVKCKIAKMSTVERSGWRMRNLTGDVDVSGKGIRVHNMELVTDSMQLVAEVDLLTDSWKSLSHYCDSVYMKVDLKPGTILAMTDAAYWAPSLWGCDTRVKVTGHVEGPVADLRVSGFTARFGRATKVSLDGSVTGLPHIKSTLFDVHVRQLQTNYADLRNVHHPKGYTMKVPELMEEIDRIELKCDLVGGADKCFADLDLRCDLGDLSGEAYAEYNPLTNYGKYTVALKSKQMQIPSIASNEWVGSSGFDLELQGGGSSMDNLSAEATIKLNNTMLKGNDIDRAVLTASVQGHQTEFDMAIQDTVLDLSGHGSIDLPKGDSPHYSLDFAINNADLQKLHLWEGDSNCSISTRLTADITGDVAKNPSGEVHMSNTRLLRDGDTLDLKHADLTLEERNGKKSAELNSDILTFSTNGYFDYADIPLIVKKFEDDYLPEYWASKKETKMSDDELASIADASLAFDLKLDDKKNKLQMILPGVEAAPGTAISGNYNYTESLKMVVRSDSIKYSGISLYDLGMNSAGQGEKYRMLIDASKMGIGGRTIFEGVQLSASSSRSDAVVEFEWDNDLEKIENQGDLAFAMHSEQEGNTISILKPHFYFNGQQWTLTKKGNLYFNNERIEVQRLDVSNANQSIQLRGQKDKVRGDYAEAKFEHFELEQLAELLPPDIGFTMVGDINGTATVAWEDKKEAPLLKANLMIGNCELNSHPLGNVNLRTNWDADNNRLHLFVNTELRQLSGVSRPLQATGYITLEQNPSMDFAVGFDNFDLESISPLLKSFSSRFEGYLTGNLDIAGTFKDPKIKGFAWVQNGLINIDAIDVAYLFDDTISFTNNNIRLNNFVLRDPDNNTAQITGNIHYADFNHIDLDLGVDADHLLIFNAKAKGNNAYGTLYTSAEGNVRGPLDKLAIDITATTLKGSEITVPVTTQKNVSSSDFIIFVSDNDYNRGEQGLQSKKESSISSDIKLNLHITPDLKVNLPMDFSGMSLDITARGEGTLKAELSPQKAPQIVGTYDISSGGLGLTLLSVLSKDFSIEEGSSLTFAGDVNAATFNVGAIYSQRVELSSLLGQNSEIAQKPIPVENVISLSGALTSPTVKFDIRMPNADQSVQDEVFAYIDRSNERDMLNQTISLLLMGKFYSTNTTSNTGNTDIVSSGAATIANTVGSVVSSMIDFVDINFDYSAATEMRSEQFSVGINKQWNKVYLESTLGYGGYDRELSSNEAIANNLVGDMLLGYKVKPQFHLYMFNRSNTNDYTRYELPYKQGFGMKFTRDFDRWRDLFKRKDKSKTKEKKQRQNNEDTQDSIQP